MANEITNEVTNEVANEMNNPMHLRMIAALVGSLTLATSVLADRTTDEAAAIDVVSQFNRGCVAAQQSDWTTAAGHFAVAATAGDKALAADARYNWGNCVFSDAITARDAGEVDRARAAVTKAIDLYLDALRLNDSLNDARANLELAVRMRQELDQSSPPKEQSEPDSGESDEESESSDDSQSDEPQSDDSQPNDSQPNDSGQDQPSEPNGENEPGQDKRQPGEQPGQEPGEQPGEQPGEDPDDADEAGESGEDGEPNQPGESEPEPAGGADPPASQGEPAGGNGESSDDDIEAEQQLPISREEAMKLLQSVRDRDLLRRFQIQQRERLKPIPVEKDW